MSLRPALLLASDALVDRLSAMLAEPAFDEDVLEEIKAEALKMTKAGDANVKAAGFMVCGMASAMSFRLNDVDRYFEASRGWVDAINLPVCRSNYLLALIRTYQFKRAAGEWSGLLEKWPGDQNVWDAAVDTCESVLDVASLEVLASKMEALKLPRRTVLDVARLKDCLVARGVKQSDLLDRIEVAAAVLRDHAARSMGTLIIALPSNEILYRFHASVPVDEAVRLNFEIAHALAEAFEDPLDHVITFGVFPHEKADA